MATLQPSKFTIIVFARNVLIIYL